jgi:hypothetical protein
VVPPDEKQTWVDSMLGSVAHLTALVTDETGARIVTLGDLGIHAGDLAELAKSGAAAGGLRQRIAEFAGVESGAVTYSAELRVRLTVAYALARLLRSSRPINAGDAEDAGPGRDPIAAFDRASQRIEWLHDLARVRPAVEAIEVLENSGLPAGLKFYTAQPGVNIVSLGEPRDDGAGLLLDGWSESTPGLQTTTGVAFHYDAPRSRAPQSILLLTPPDLAQPWNFASVEGSLLELDDLVKMRMVRPADVWGTFLPALYFAHNLKDETISTDWLQHGIVMKVKE